LLTGDGLFRIDVFLPEIEAAGLLGVGGCGHGWGRLCGGGR
jgi:hypothetical protein